MRPIFAPDQPASQLHPIVEWPFADWCWKWARLRTSCKRSAFGDTNHQGMDGNSFWLQIKTVTQRWPDSSVDDGNAIVIPTMG